MSARRTVLALLALGAAAALVLAAGPAQACAVCGLDSTAGDPMARGFYWGILFLGAMPFSIAGAVGGWLAFLHWRARDRPRRQSVWERVRDATRAPFGAVACAGKETER